MGNSCMLDYLFADFHLVPPSAPCVVLGGPLMYYTIYVTNIALNGPDLPLEVRA